ncbi:MAG TPA: molybdopterin-dependent oxidoreductase [candidate division Zixibacteria bacterium]|nr:molybdopterin-dependent oxidoreductase [candidate division Zixibacteria bacterium]
MNKKNVIVLVVIFNVVLAASIIALYFTVFDGYNRDEEWTITISGDITQEVSLNISELELLPKISQEYIIQGNPTFSAEYTGISLLYLINDIANITQDVNVNVKAIDQYSHTLNFKNEIETNSDIIIAYMKNGEYIKSYSDGGEGPLRLIIPQKFEGDFNGQFCIKFVVEIEIIAL